MKSRIFLLQENIIRMCPGSQEKELEKQMERINEQLKGKSCFGN